MKVLLIFSIIISLYSCRYNSQSEEGKTVNIYIAGCDSIFYTESEKPIQGGLKGSKKDDSVFIQKIIESASSSHQTVLIKPFGGNCGGTAETTINLATLFAQHKLITQIIMPDSNEEKLFNDVSLQTAMQNFLSETGGFKLNIPKDEEQYDTIKIKAEACMTFLPATGHRLFYYTGNFKNTMTETDYTSAKDLINQFKKSVNNKDLMYLVKADNNIKYKNIIDLLDLFTACKVTAGHYAEVEITEKEKTYLASIASK